MNTARKFEPQFEVEPPAQAPPRSAMAALVSVQFLFGVHYVVSKVMVTLFPPLVWAGLRGVLTTILMFATCLALRRPKPKLDKDFFSSLIVLSALGIWLNQAFFLTGLSLTTSSNAAVLNSLIPVLTLLLVSLLGREQLTVRGGLGFVSAFIGILILCRVEKFSVTDDTFRGDILILLNCFCFALFLTFGKKFMTSYDHFWGTAWLFLVGSVFINLLAIPQWIDFKWPVMSNWTWFCLVYGVVGATFLTYLLNNYALKHIQASKVALLIYFQPIVASALAYFWLGETLSNRTIVASVFIFVGIFLSLYKHQARLLDG